MATATRQKTATFLNEQRFIVNSAPFRICGRHLMYFYGSFPIEPNSDHISPYACSVASWPTAKSTWKCGPSHTLSGSQFFGTSTATDWSSASSSTAISPLMGSINALDELIARNCMQGASLALSPSSHPLAAAFMQRRASRPAPSLHLLELDHVVHHIREVALHGEVRERRHLPRCCHQ